MRVIRREFYSVSRSDEFRIYPLGDIHLGAAACDEDKFRRVIAQIAEDDRAYWISMGDVADFINRSDPRFSPSTLASWIKISDLADLARAQRDRYLELVKPIAHKCLAMVMGNHEMAIHKHYERAIHSEIVAGVKEAAGWDAEYPLDLGYYGYLHLHFYASEKREGVTRIVFNLHHGFTGGRLAGAKALNMQRWLWTHNADVVIFGHSHNTGTQVEAVEQIDRAGRVTYHKRIGCYSGTFLRSINEGTSTYSEVKGYLPMPTAGCVVVLRPRAENESDRVRVVSGF